MLYEFTTEIKNIQEDYHSDDGWPVFIDKFVEFLKKKK
jgi:hypothetical protein